MMEPPQGLQHQTRSATNRYQWWIRISVYTLFLISGQSAATLLGRLYYNKGGNSKWMATLVQSAGFPILIPLLYFFTSPPTTVDATSSNPPPIATIIALYLFFGLLLSGDNLMYSYGLLYLPVSTYSLLCATQLAFNAIFSYFINAQKFTILILNSLFVLTISASLLAVHSDSDETGEIPKGKYIIGFLCTISASATFSLYLSLIQFSFDKIIKKETFRKILNMQIYPSFIASCACVVGLFASGEWETIRVEMKGYQKGKVSYVMTLVWTAVAWQVMSIGMIGLIFEVTSLFSNMIASSKALKFKLSVPLVDQPTIAFSKALKFKLSVTIRGPCTRPGKQLVMKQKAVEVKGLQTFDIRNRKVSSTYLK